MATYASDEEQIEALKRWWKDNGTSLMTGVVIVLAIYLGVGQFQNARVNTSAEASALYQQLADLAMDSVSSGISETDLLAAQAVYSQLKDEYSDSIYARYAALVMARFQVEHEQLDMAAGELQWVMDNQSLGLMREADPELYLVARQRLAKIRLAQGDAAGALELLQVDSLPEPFTAGYAELQGDAQLALGDKEAAIGSYERARLAMEALGSGNPGVLNFKLQALGIDPAEL